jgi:hypothetical protein
MVPLPPNPAPLPAAESPPTPPGFVPSAPPPAPGTGELTHVRGVELSLAVCHWLPVVCLTLILILTFFAWVVIAPNGTSAFWQSPWGSLFNGYSQNDNAETVFGIRAEIDKNLHSTWVFLIPYLFGLIAIVSLGWVDRIFESSKRVAMPTPLVWIEPIWPYRMTAMTIGAGLLLFLILVQSAKGFGLEAAIAAAKQQGVKEMQDSIDPAKQYRIPYEVARATAYLTPEGTTVKSVAILFHLLALAGLLGRYWLYRRETKPPPRLELRW